MKDTGDIQEPSAKHGRPGLRTFVLLLLTFGLHLFVWIGWYFVPFLNTWIESSPLFSEILLRLVMPTLWAAFLQFRYRKTPERVASDIALLGAIGWWVIFFGVLYTKHAIPGWEG